MSWSADRDAPADLRRRRFVIRKGLRIAPPGAPTQVIDSGRDVRTVALLGRDYPGLRPSMLVRENERVRQGQPLFVDRHNPEVPFVSPGTGVVAAIHRGARRALEAVVIELDGDDASTAPPFEGEELQRLSPQRLREILLASGAWTAFRARPYGKVAVPGAEPQALFVTAIDTRPLAPDPAVVIEVRREAFAHGLHALERLTSAPIFLCTGPGTHPPIGEASRITVAEFRGPHPAGLVGTHIHLLAPVSLTRRAWHIGYQDVIAIGDLLATGRMPAERVIALAGPGFRQPRLVRTRLGACVGELTDGELTDGEVRLLSGCPLAGRAASGDRDFLGRYHSQVTALTVPAAPEKRRRFRWWPWHRRRVPAISQVASPPMIPVDTFERLMPLDILPTPLFRALLAGDVDTAAGLGCLELEEEDLALCRTACPSGIDYGGLLRSALVEIEAQA